MHYINVILLLKINLLLDSSKICGCYINIYQDNIKHHLLKPFLIILTLKNERVLSDPKERFSRRMVAEKRHPYVYDEDRCDKIEEKLELVEDAPKIEGASFQVTPMKNHKDDLEESGEAKHEIDQKDPSEEEITEKTKM